MLTGIATQQYQWSANVHHAWSTHYPHDNLHRLVLLVIKILRELNLGTLVDRFDAEKIEPDNVISASDGELTRLGVPTERFKSWTGRTTRVEDWTPPTPKCNSTGQKYRTPLTLVSFLLLDLDDTADRTIIFQHPRARQHDIAVGKCRCCTFCGSI